MNEANKPIPIDHNRFLRGARMKSFYATHRLFRLSMLPLLVSMLILGCSEAPTSVLDEEGGIEAPSAAASSSSAAMAASDGAFVLKFDDVFCFLPAVAENGEVFPVFDIPCDVKVIDSQNGNDNATFILHKANVTNESGRAVQVTFNNPLPIPCTMFTASGFVESENYQFSIAANGNITGVCHLPE